MPYFIARVNLWLSLLQAPLQCSVYVIDCMAKNPRCRLSYSGEPDCLHFWTHSTAAGDEIGFDFVGRVEHSKISFTAFCEEMTRRYKLFAIESACFMSRSTFVSWFFSWAARMRIDFRKHIDPWCGRNPPVVAGDGTHIGLTVRNLHIEPIDRAAPDADIQQPSHRRYDRVFLSYANSADKGAIRNARATLLQACNQALSEDRADPAISAESVHNLIRILPDDDAVKSVISKFLNRGFMQPVHGSLASFLKLLACDAPVSALLPFRYLDQIKVALNSFLATDGSDQAKSFNEIKSFCPELAYLLKTSLSFGEISCIVPFVLYLVIFVHNVHSTDNPAPNLQLHTHSYNPESGVAYYFTETGDTVRNLQNYAMSEDAENTCHKQYPLISSGGFSHTFLWFCPIHGHCYGFHLINGAEGRKDPFASLVKYAPIVPNEIFYDFACGLSEYALNREPELFRNSRFWHDVFHGYSHKCAASHRSTRISSLSAVNSEICEQFNAYIQCVKYTGSHLSQSHFTFFLQFFIYFWNIRKTATFSQYARYVVEDMS